MKRIRVARTPNSQRLDLFILKREPNLSRSFIKSLIDSSHITVNGSAQKAGYSLKAGDILTIDYNPKDQQKIPTVNIPIIYEDDDCIVLDKPAGILSHSKGSYNPEATVATYIKNKTTGLEGERAGIVHRLDRMTSGVMIAAKNPSAQAWLQKQFSSRKVKKTYIAVINGRIDPKSAIIDMPIGRDPKNPKNFKVSAAGRSSETQYKTISTSEAYSMLELKPLTGRTHQIRVHLKQIGHPIVGDSLYGGTPNKRLLLHAYRLEITLPSKHRKTFISKLPPDFNTLMDQP